MIRTLIYTLLAVPSLFILLPQIPSIVIGLGMSVLFVSAVLTTLLIVLLLPNLLAPQVQSVISKPNAMERLLSPQSIMLTTACVVFVMAMTQSSYSSERKKTNSLNYVYNQDTQQAFLISHNQRLDDFIAPVFKDHTQDKDWNNANYPQSRRTPVRWQAPVTPLVHNPASVNIIGDHTSDGTRTVELYIQRNSPSNHIYLASTKRLAITSMAINGETFTRPNQRALAITYGAGFFARYMFAQPENLHEALVIRLQVAAGETLDLRLFEISYDLMERMPQLDRRDDTMMPEPFIINDAVIVGQSIKLSR